ncbi:MAG: alpha-amylase family glycosyl hydrolase [Chloroflexota bacterium]
MDGTSTDPAPPVDAGSRFNRRGDAGRRPAVTLVAVLLAAGCGSPQPTSSTSAPGSGSLPPSGSADIACPLPTPMPFQAGGWWNDRVFYELFVRSFADSNGDGIGDLRGLTARLDYLSDGERLGGDDLGVGALWLMPIFSAVSYHGYDVIDYDQIDPRYGDVADFAAFVDAAHQRDIKVILDLVINHTSAEHPWFRDAVAGGPYRDWYIWRDSDPGWPGVAGGSPWHETPSGWYYGAFGAQMPDLNLANPAVTAEIERIARDWLDKGVDGFRLDAAKHLIETGPSSQVNTLETRAWLSRFRDALHATHPDALVLGEVWEPRVVTTGYVSDGSLDMAFDFGFGPAALDAARLGDATTLTVGLSEIADRYPAGTAATFLTNHDQPRVMTELRGDRVAARQAAEALLTGPGVPFVYYGEELGLRGAKPDEDIRTPFPWTAADPGFGFTTGTPWEAFAPDPRTANVAVEAADPTSLLSTYRDLIRTRSTAPVLGRGGVWPVEVARRDLAVTLRWQGNQGALVIQNLGERPAESPAMTLATGPLCGNPRAAVIFRSAGTADQGAATGQAIAASPSVTPGGGLKGYVPLPLIPARTTIVVALTP